MFQPGKRDHEAFVGYQRRGGVGFGFADGRLTCWLSPRAYVLPIICGLAFGPYLTIVIRWIVLSNDWPPWFVGVVVIVVNLIGWLALADSLLFRRRVIIDFARQVIVMRRTSLGSGDGARTIDFADIRRFVRSTSTRSYPSDDFTPDVDRLHLLSIEMADGHFVRLLESTQPDPIDRIAAIVEREADGVAVSANG